MTCALDCRVSFDLEIEHILLSMDVQWKCNRGRIDLWYFSSECIRNLLYPGSEVIILLLLLVIWLIEIQN